MEEVKKLSRQQAINNQKARAGIYDGYRAGLDQAAREAGQPDSADAKAAGGFGRSYDYYRRSNYISAKNYDNGYIAGLRKGRELYAPKAKRGLWKKLNAAKERMWNMEFFGHEYDANGKKTGEADINLQGIGRRAAVYVPSEKNYKI